MEIVLLRHGVPAIDTSGRMNASEFGRWLRAYDAAGIKAEHPPSPEAVAAAADSFVVCSHLPRSTQSAAALGVSTGLSSVDFREVEMPHAEGHRLRLSPKGWCVTFRLLWAAGYAPGVETLTEARSRSRTCATQLARLAGQHGRVLFVGHGSLLWQLARDLTRDGWRGPAKAPRRHWEFGIYRPEA